MSEQFAPIGQLVGHEGWVTQIATTPQYPEVILSASRGMVDVLNKIIFRTEVVSVPPFFCL
jgi:guanine nucleotide-binding protein subunit beta-2-like 1 protein